MQQTQLSADEAAAELFVRELKKAGVIGAAWRKPDSNIVCAVTGGHGMHLGNFQEDYEFGVHLICSTSKVTQSPDGVDPEEHGDIYFNVVVDGVSESPTGAALPTHTATKSGAKPVGEIPDDVRRLADAAGLDV